MSFEPRIVAFLCNWCSYRGADLLCVSVKTVLGHRTNIMEKLDIHNRTELIKYALRKYLITLEN